MEAKTDKIRELNDQLRQNFAGGAAVMTPGIAALGAEAVARIVKTVAVFDDFCHANDPHEEHDFGAFDADGQRVFFKIDYFDESLSYHSPDPADPSVTKRVITIMLAEEY
jgi:hypothetical protein